MGLALSGANRLKTLWISSADCSISSQPEAVAPADCFLFTAIVVVGELASSTIKSYLGKLSESAAPV
jgi:hypothetical protein